MSIYFYILFILCLLDYIYHYRILLLLLPIILWNSFSKFRGVIHLGLGSMEMHLVYTLYSFI